MPPFNKARHTLLQATTSLPLSRTVASPYERGFHSVSSDFTSRLDSCSQSHILTLRCKERGCSEQVSSRGDGSAVEYSLASLTT